jgi:hypothetical protein
LMSRVLAVLLNIPFPRALGWVLVAAALEVILVLFFGSLFGGSISRHILASMAGMRNAPEEMLLTSVLGFVWTWAWVLLLICVISLAARRFRGTAEPLPKLLPGHIPWASLVVLLALWVLIAISPQKEQRHFVTHTELVRKGAFAEALAYLGKHQKSDFPPSRRLEPNPYEIQAWQELPQTIALLTPETAPWIRHVYLNHLQTMSSHYYMNYDSATNVASMLSALERLPEGREWLQTNQSAIAAKGFGFHNSDTETNAFTELSAKTNILETLSRMGMAQSNLALLSK